jgi:hypothetical protein
MGLEQPLNLQAFVSNEIDQGLSGLGIRPPGMRVVIKGGVNNRRTQSLGIPDHIRIGVARRMKN